MVSYMSVADGRPTQALKWVIANHQEADDVNIQRRAIGSALRAWWLMLPFMTLIGAILVWISPLVVKTPPEFITVVRVACSLLVFNLMLLGITSLPTSVLRGMNLEYKCMGVVAGMNVLDGLLVAGALYLDWGLIGVAGAHLIQNLLTGLLFWYLVKTSLPWFGVAKTSRQEARNFLSLSIWYAGWNLVHNLLLFSDVMLLGLILSATAVTQYTLTGYVAQVLIEVTTMIIGAAAPGLGGLIGQRQYERVVALRKEMLWISSFVAGVLGSMILLWNKSFITLWVGEEHYTGPVINLLLVLMAIQLLFLRNESYLIDLTLDLRRKVILGIMSVLLSIGLAAVLTHWMGILGLCLGILGGRMLLTIAYPAITTEFLGVSWLSQFKPMLRSTFVMIGLFILATYLGQIIKVDRWIMLIGYTSLSIPIVAVIFWGIGFSSQERKQLVKRISNLKFLAKIV